LALLLALIIALLLRRSSRSVAVLLATLIVIGGTAATLVRLVGHDQPPRAPQTFSLGLAPVLDGPSALTPLDDHYEYNFLHRKPDATWVALGATISNVRDPSQLTLTVEIPRRPANSQNLAAYLGQVDVRPGEINSESAGATLTSSGNGEFQLEAPRHMYLLRRDGPDSAWTEPLLVSRNVESRVTPSAYNLHLDVGKLAADYVESGDDLRFALELVAHSPVSGPFLAVDGRVRKVGDVLWSDELTITEPADLEFSATYYNLGDQQAGRTIVRATLPPAANVAYVPGSARVYVAGDLPKGHRASDNLTNGGLSYRSFGPHTTVDTLYRVHTLTSDRTTDRWFTAVSNLESGGVRSTYYDSSRVNILLP